MEIQKAIRKAFSGSFQNMAVIVILFLDTDSWPAVTNIYYSLLSLTSKISFTKSRYPVYSKVSQVAQLCPTLSKPTLSAAYQAPLSTGFPGQSTGVAFVSTSMQMTTQIRSYGNYLLLEERRERLGIFISFKVFPSMQ